LSCGVGGYIPDPLSFLFFFGTLHKKRRKKNCPSMLIL
jgi:hypothetical protein